MLRNSCTTLLHLPVNTIDVEYYVHEGNLDMCKYCNVGLSFAYNAAVYGHLHILEWLHTFGRFDDNCVVAAANNGHLHILEWLHNNEYPIDQTDYTIAAQNGHLHIIEWLYQRSADVDFAHLAAIIGHLPILQSCNDISIDTCTTAAIHGHIDCLEWLIDNDCECDFEVCDSAAQYGQCDVVKYLYSRGFRCQDGLALAAASGNLELVQWLYDHNAPINGDEFECAASSGNIEMLDWLYDNGFVLDYYAYRGAICAGNIDVCEWLFEHNCPGGDNACMIACEINDLSMLHELRDHGFVYNRDALLCVATSDIAEYI